MDRRRASHVAQATWRSGALHVWGWDGATVASAAWLYSGFGRNRWSGSDNAWHDSPVSYGQVGRLTLELPSGRSLLAPVVRLDPYGAAVWLSETPSGRELSPSIRWSARLTRIALDVVAAGRLTPLVVEADDELTARWQPLLDAELQRAVHELAPAMPPIARLGWQPERSVEPHDGAETTGGVEVLVRQLLAHLVDGIARTMLQADGWRPELGRRRTTEVQVARAVLQALARPDPIVRAGSEDFTAGLYEFARNARRVHARLTGRPLPRPRLRLTIPADAGDPWHVELELVDDLDPQRWCTLAELWAGAPPAVALAGDGERPGDGVHRLRGAALELAEAVAEYLPVVGARLDTVHPTGVDLELDAAEEFLEAAPYELARLGIELIGPEHLVRSTVAVRGVAAPSPSDERQQKFGKEALVSWSAVVDGEELSPAELERVAAAGATLLHTGHRWVRIDPAGLRRARTKLEELTRTRSRVGALDLLRLAADDETPVRLGDDGRDDDDRDDEEPVVDPEAQLAAELAELDRRPTVELGWVGDLLAGLPDNSLREATEPIGFVGELRHYQRRGLAWLGFLAELGLGGCLADDMGLGKTATTLAHLVARPGPHLVVCPLSVVHNWESEARRFTPGLRVVVHHGADRHRGPAEESGLAEADLVVTTYGLVARDPSLAEIEWSTVVLDEAQMVKNPATKSARAVRRLPAGQKLALTGTPVENRLTELWAILDVVVPGLLGGQQSFRERFAGPIERSGDAEVAARLRRLTAPFVLRRTKADRRLLPDLPDKLEQVAYATLTREQAALYQQVVDQLLMDAEHTSGMQRRSKVLAAITRLKQICNHPAHALKDGSRLAGRSGKLERFDELVTDLLDLGERALVFTQFREMGELLERHLAESRQLHVPFLHGGVARGGRMRMVEAFQDGSGPPLLLVSLKAGGTGLNLTAASQVVHYDRWWNPAVEDQATDRAWRIGQRRTVNVHKLVCQGTVEERIGAVIDEKRALADAVIGTGETWLTELATDELRDLVTLERERP